VEQAAAGHEGFYQLLQVLQQSPMPADVPKLAANCGMSESTFRRGCKLLTGTSPLAYLRQIRMERARQLLASGELRIRDVARECGFNDEFYFSRVFRQEMGCSPSVYRIKNVQTFHQISPSKGK
jgi:AraC-like DNA-binding protein